MVTYRALVVDDSDDVRTLCKRALELQGIACDEAADGIAAENAMRRTKYDALITDLKMPRKHGHRLIVETLEKDAPPLIVVITGMMEPKLVADLISRGVVDVMQKPIAWQVLAAKIYAYLERRTLTGAAGARVSAGTVSTKIAEATATLKSQLQEVTQNFHETIKQLEKQRENLEEGFVGSMRVLTSIFTQADREKGSHAGRVESMAVTLAKNIDLAGERLRNVRIAALLHEIGMFCMPDAVRFKAPWELSPDELRAYQKYPLVGATLLSELPGGEEIAELIEAHAENFDGTGFPAGIRGDKIPLAARVLRIADGCDTFLMYGVKGQARTEIREHLYSQRGKYYDPKLVDHAFQYLSEEIERSDAEKSAWVPVGEILTGQILAENVYDGEGRFLARQGAVVTNNMLHLLHRLMGNSKVRVYTTQKEDAAGLAT